MAKTDSCLGVGDDCKLSGSSMGLCVFLPFVIIIIG